MSQGFTSQMARNIFYGGTTFFVLLFAALIFHTETKIPERSKSAELTPAVVRGKHLWETRNCIGCHTLLGEGAYFAPELGNVYTRRGPDFIKAWMKAQPTGAPGRLQAAPRPDVRHRLDRHPRAPRRDAARSRGRATSGLRASVDPPRAGGMAGARPWPHV